MFVKKGYVLNKPDMLLTLEVIALDEMRKKSSKKYVLKAESILWLEKCQLHLIKRYLVAMPTSSIETIPLAAFSFGELEKKLSRHKQNTTKTPSPPPSKSNSTIAMASSLASQLQRIASSTASTLSAKKAKALHSTSLLFPASHAASQDFETIYAIALDGYRELVALDPRFEHFSTGIFSESSKSVDRYTQTKAEIAELDRSCTEFLQLASAWVRLKPTLKAIEWLIRRFRYGPSSGDGV